MVKSVESTTKVINVPCGTFITQTCHKLPCSIAPTKRANASGMACQHHDAPYLTDRSEHSVDGHSVGTRMSRKARPEGHPVQRPDLNGHKPGAQPGARGEDRARGRRANTAVLGGSQGSPPPNPTPVYQGSRRHSANMKRTEGTSHTFCERSPHSHPCPTLPFFRGPFNEP